MKFTVVFTPSAKRRLAELYLQTVPDSLERKYFTDAANEIERLLKIDPQRIESVYGNRYFLFQSPLGVVYDVYPDDCIVKVIMIWKRG